MYRMCQFGVGENNIENTPTNVPIKVPSNFFKHSRKLLPIIYLKVIFMFPFSVFNFICLYYFNFNFALWLMSPYLCFIYLLTQNSTLLYLQYDYIIIITNLLIRKTTCYLLHHQILESYFEFMKFRY